MRATSAAPPPKGSGAVRAILWGGLIAGACDITYAFVRNGLRGAGPVRVLQSVASGLLGADAFQGGLKTAALGAALHFLIALTAATVFYVVSRRLRFLVRHAVVAGLLYGSAIYPFMYLVVIPLSAAPFKINYTPGSVALDLGAHMLLIGLPIALAARRHSE